jgi:5-methyltetrahydrofolate--homocysteine methyltransferase
MDGMNEVGRLFNNNELIVAEVLLSAESMKAAVGYLEPYMEKTDSALKGKIILATVKGDVHDIGKNLVDIILTNNGFEVINLGIKVPPQQLIARGEAGLHRAVRVAGQIGPADGGDRSGSHDGWHSCAPPGRWRCPIE